MLLTHICKTRYLYTALSKAQHDWFRVQSLFTQSEKIAKDISYMKLSFKKKSELSKRLVNFSIVPPKHLKRKYKRQ